MRKLFSCTLFLIPVLLFSSCKKKDIEPKASSAAAPLEASATLMVSGITQILDASSEVYPDHYRIMGRTATGNYKELNADFYQGKAYHGKPTKDTVVTLSPLHTRPTLTIWPNDNMLSYTAISGQVSIKVIGSTVSLSFQDVVFMRVNDSSDKITASGTLVVLN